MAGETLQTIRMVGPGGELIVNARDEKFYETQGYQVWPEHQARPQPPKPPEPTDLEKLDVGALKEMAVKLSVPGFEGMKKAELITAIKERQAKA